MAKIALSYSWLEDNVIVVVNGSSFSINGADLDQLYLALMKLSSKRKEARADIREIVLAAWNERADRAAEAGA